MAASPKHPVGNPLRAAASDDYSTLDNEGDTGSARRRHRSRWMLALAVITACCVGSALAVIFRKDVLRACYRIGRLPPVAGGLLFSALLALWLTCLLPTSLLEIAAGYVFGFFWATVWSTVGKVAGSVLSYWIGRCARSSVRRMILPDDTSKEHGYLRGLEIAMTEEPGRTCLALRLAYVPEAIQNYVLNGSDPRGFASHEEAQWLIGQVEIDGRVCSMTELELLTRIIERAQNVPETLKAYVLGVMEREVLEGSGPTRCGGELSDTHVSAAECRIMRRVVFGQASDRPAAVSRREATRT